MRFDLLRSPISAHCHAKTIFQNNTQTRTQDQMVAQKSRSETISSASICTSQYFANYHMQMKRLKIITSLQGTKFDLPLKCMDFYLKKHGICCACLAFVLVSTVYLADIISSHFACWHCNLNYFHLMCPQKDFFSVVVLILCLFSSTALISSILQNFSYHSLNFIQSVWILKQKRSSSLGERD